MMMQCTKTTRFSSSGFAGCHNSTPLTMDLALEIRLMVPEGRSAICVFSLRVDPRDTTNKRSLSVIVERTLRKQQVEGRASTNKATLNFDRKREPMHSHPLQCTKANRRGSRHGGQSITHPNYYSAQSVEKRATILGIRLKISTIEVQKQRSDADSASDLA